MVKMNGLVALKREGASAKRFKRVRVERVSSKGQCRQVSMGVVAAVWMIVVQRFQSTALVQIQSVERIRAMNMMRCTKMEYTM
jgi:hypothetical protein